MTYRSESHSRDDLLIHPEFGVKLNVRWGIGYAGTSRTYTQRRHGCVDGLGGPDGVRRQTGRTSSFGIRSERAPSTGVAPRFQNTTRNRHITLAGGQDASQFLTGPTKLTDRAIRQNAELVRAEFACIANPTPNGLDLAYLVSEFRC